MLPLHSLLAGAVGPGPEGPEAGYATVIVDLARAFSNAGDTSDATVVTDSSGALELRAIRQPAGIGDPSEILHTIDVPDCELEARALLTFGLSIEGGSQSGTADSVPVVADCAVIVEGLIAFEAVVSSDVPRDYALDLTSYAGTTVRVATRVETQDESPAAVLWNNPALYLAWPCDAKRAPARLTSGLLVRESQVGVISARRFSLDESTAIDDAYDHLMRDEDAGEGLNYRLYAHVPQLRLDPPSTHTHLMFRGKDYEVRATLTNIGEVAVEDFQQVRLTISGAPLRRGRAERAISRLAPGDQATVSWQMRGIANRESTDVTIGLKSGVPGLLAETSITSAIKFHRPVPPLPARTSKELRSVVQNEYALLENEVLRIAFVREEGRVPYYVLFAQKGGRLNQVATGGPLSELSYLGPNGQTREMVLEPDDVTLGGSSAGDASLFFQGISTDEDGVEWTFRATFTLYERSRRIQTEYTLIPSTPVKLLSFTGPVLRVGDGAAGSNKEFAVFPGLEFLEGDEASSSSRDAAPPLDNRFVPHPCKVSIPAMAVQQKGVTTGILWDQLQPWDGEGLTGVSAMFASPNFHEQEDNHLLGVFLPSVDGWVPENETRATKPYDLDANGIQIRAQLFVDPVGTIFDVPDLWCEAFGRPKPIDPPRDDREELLVSRDGFMVATWDPKTEKSRHCVGWGTANSPGFATLLWYDYLASGDETVKDRVELIVRRTIEESGPEALASGANCHILRWELPFYIGYVEEAAEGARREVAGILAEQEKDGSWRFRPGDPKKEVLGRVGDAVLGTCAMNAVSILKYTRIFGDQTAADAGVRALEFMNQFALPRGGQGWECPLYEPDLLAAGFAVGAYLEGYALTGDAAYATRAEYWAKTGLPFLYHWHLPDRPLMQYATLPVFGTTFFTHSWFGVPVQWNGLVYAYYVQRLAALSDYPWRTVAEGITNSAMHQQWTEGELRGTYPDAVYEHCTVGRAPHLNPEDIMVNLLSLRGHDPDVSTSLIEVGGKRAHITSGALVENAVADPESLRFSLSGVPGHPTHVLIANSPRIGRVEIGGQELPAVDSFEGIENGWRNSPENESLVLRLRQTDPSMLVTIYPPARPATIDASDVDAEMSDIPSEAPDGPQLSNDAPIEAQPPDPDEPSDDPE